MWIVGTVWKSLSSEFGVTFTRIIPMPPARFTSADLSTRVVDPRSQTTM